MENSGITRTYGAITVDHVAASQFKAHVDQAQIRQVVKTTYPSKKVGNSLADSLFSIDAYNLPEGQSFDSTRVTWIDVPKGTTKEQVEQLLAGLTAAGKKPTIARIISNNVEDVLTAEQKVGIAQGLRTLADYKESLRVKDANGNDLEGAPQYRQYFFKKEATEDMDLRVAAPVAAPAANVEAGMNV